MAQKKECRKCKTYKKPSEFYIKGKSLESICKECKKAKRRQRYAGEKKTYELSRLASFASVMLEAESERLERDQKQAYALLEQIEKRLSA